MCKWAVAPGYREDNPAGEAISAALPRNAVRPPHQRALPYAEVGVALESVRGSGAYLGTLLAFEPRPSPEPGQGPPGRPAPPARTLDVVEAENPLG